MLHKDFRDFLALLAKHEVRHLVVGGVRLCDWMTSTCLSLATRTWSETNPQPVGARIKWTWKNLSGVARPSRTRPHIGRTTVNFAPADIKKEGPIFDLPIALNVSSSSSSPLI